MEIMRREIRAKLIEVPDLPSFEEITQEQNILNSLPDLNQDTDTSTLDSDDETYGLYVYDENDDSKY